MRISLSGLILCLCLTAGANPAVSGPLVGLPTDAISMEPLAGQVVEVTDLKDGLEIEFMFVAKNCVDQVTPVLHVDVGGTLVVSAWNVSRKLSYWSPCANFPVVQQILRVPGARRPLRVEFLGTAKSFLIE